MGHQLVTTVLCLLLGLSLSPIVLAQPAEFSVGEPLFGVEKDVVLSKKYVARARINGKIQLDCKVAAPGRFKVWLKDSFVVGVEPTLQVPADNPNVFGVYYCLADPEISPKRYRALEFVITDMPSEDQTSEVSVQPNQDISITCKITSPTGSYKWYKYNEEKFTFIEIRGQTGKQLALTFTDLNKDHGKGFTFYKCVDQSNTRLFHAFKVVRDPSREMIDGSMTNVYEQSMRSLPTDVATVPISVTPKSKVTFECHKVRPDESTQWFFRDNNTVSPGQYGEIRESGGVEIQNNPDSSVLSVKNCDVKNKGYYRCIVGQEVKYAFLDIRVIVPTIHEYGKGIYDLAKSPGIDNELECEIPIGGEVKDVVWRIVPSDGSPSYDIAVNRNRDGFETSIKDSGSNQLVTIKFQDSPRFHNYRLECRLGDELDYVTLRSEPPIQIELAVSGSNIRNYILLNCTFDTRLRDIMYHINRDINELPFGSPQSPHQLSTGDSWYYFKEVVENKWFRCSGIDPSGKRVYSDPQPLFKDPLMLDIRIDGSDTSRDPRFAKVEGQRTEFSCDFTNYKDVDIRPENVKLVFEGRVLPNTPTIIRPGVYRFVFDSPRPDMSGKYYCIHNSDIQKQKVRSQEVTINWCEINQFKCDNRCRDKSVVCNGIRECTDGTDELPTLCSPCEPNEVACQDWKGVRASRNCVLKHWLCDGTDDCENGYDEESPLSKEWCTNTCTSRSWLACPYNSTCCESNNKCIPRAYECDTEADCPTSEDEMSCCSLTLTDPTRRQLVQQREGSRVTLTCTAFGNERPTISWRCNWGKLRDESRMKETNKVVRKDPSSNHYIVEGTLVIENFTKSDECIYNCEAVTKCKRQMSPEFDVKVGAGDDCNNKTCGIGGVCEGNVCNCKINVEGAKCDKCKRGYHSLNKDHPDGCVPCFCSDRSNLCENAGLYFEEKSVSPIEASQVRLMGWSLYGVYEQSTSHEKVSVTGSEIAVPVSGDTMSVPRDDDESYVFITSLEGKRLSSYGGKVSFTVRANVPMGGALEPYTSFPVFGIKGWRGPTLVYWDHKTNRAPETRFSVTLDERNLRAIDGSPVSRQDVMTALSDLRGIFFRVYHFMNQRNTAILDIKYETATAASGDSPAPVERCTICPEPYKGAFCDECKTDGDFHKIIDYNSTVNRWKCVPCKEGYKDSPRCSTCEEGYADKILGRPSGEKPECEEYVLPIVEPETLNIPSGRTVVLTCRIRRQKPGYNGTAWLLEWQSADGARIGGSARVFQVRVEESLRLVIRDVSQADTGRYRCEGYNRRSGTAYAFANLTVESRSVKKVVLRTVAKNPDTSVVQCSLIAKEPVRPNQFRATLTRLPFPVNQESEDFEVVRYQVNGANFSGQITYDIKNNDDSGFWTCHVSDLFSNYTVSRRAPFVLKPQQTFNWDLNTPVDKVERPVGSAVRLKCNKVIRSPNQITIPIDWSFVPANSRASTVFANPLGSPERKIYSTMDEKMADSLPPGASRDGDDLVLNPLSIEHWGTFSCQRQPETRSPISSRSNSMSSLPESYESKRANIEVVPTLIGSSNINLEEGDSISLPCIPATGNLDDDGLPCHRYSWVYKSQKSAKQLLGRHASAKMLQLPGENKPLFNITNSQHVDSGMYYCRCHTFYRPGRSEQFSKVMEYNVFVSVKEDVPPFPRYLVKERKFVDQKTQWLYCYDETAVPPAKVWWEVWSKPATDVPGVVLAGEDTIGNRSYSNITFVMDKHEHQVFFACNAKNDVGHKTVIINMRYASSDYDPLRLKIIIETTYDMLHKVQDIDHAVVDKVHAPMDQFNRSGEGYRDNMIIMCHMTGNPFGYELELVRDDPTSPSDVPNLIRQCRDMQTAANVVYCNVSRYWDYVNYKWQCRAKQENPETKVVTTYTKNLEFVKIPSKVKIRFHYHKWYSYDERNLKFYMLRGGVAVLKCDASYYENEKLTEIPFPHQYEFYIHGERGLPHFAKQTGNVLILSDIPASLHNKEIVCFVRPQNKSDIATYGFGQRYFTISVFTMPEKPSILVTMQDKSDASLIIRNPDTIPLQRGGAPTELTCTLNNYDSEVDKNSGSVRYLDWVKCKNYQCNYADADPGTETSVSSMEKKLGGNKAVLKVQTSSVKNSGIFMCVAVRPYVNVTGGKDLQLKSVPVKALVLTKPGEGDDSRTFGVMTVQRTSTGDIEFDCFFVGYPFPDLEINRFDIDNRDVKLESPRWMRQYQGVYFDDKGSFRYGSQLKYKLPKENIGADSAKGNYVCSAKNSLGTAEAEHQWDG